MVGPDYDYDQGFQHFELMRGKGAKRHLEGSSELNAAAFRWLDRYVGGRLFLYMHYMDPHVPYITPAPYKTLYVGDELSDANGHRDVPVRKVARIDGSTDQDFYIAQYDAEIRYVDDSLGMLMKRLEVKGLLEDTLIVVTADHGEDLGEHDFFFDHGHNCYEPTTHVPLLFAHPDLPGGRRVPEPVSLVDVLPTIRELLLLPKDPELQGRSFAPLLLGHEDAATRKYNFTIGEFRPGYQTPSVSTDRFKLVSDIAEHWPHVDVGVEALARAWTRLDLPSLKYRARVVRRELYDLEEDPGETVNLAGTGLAVEAELAKELTAWMDWVYGPGSMLGAHREELTEEMLEDLRGLGYLGD